MVFYAVFNGISVISRQQLTLFMLSWVSPVLGWALKCLAQGHSHEKTQCGSNPGPLDYVSNTLPLSHVGPYNGFYTPVEDGTIMGSPVASGRSASSSLPEVYLQTHTTYGHDILWVDRSHQRGVQCT